MYQILILIGMISAITSGCAYTRVIPIDLRDRSTEGLRAYDTKPVLIVGNSIDIKFIPNYSRAYAVQFGAFLAKNEFSVQIENGVIKQLDSNLDSTAIIDLLKSIAEKAIPVGGTADKTTGAGGGPVQIYDFEFDEYGNLVAFRPVPFLGGRPSTHRVSAPPLVGLPSPGPSQPSSPTAPSQPNRPEKG